MSKMGKITHNTALYVVKKQSFTVQKTYITSKEYVKLDICCNSSYLFYFQEFRKQFWSY